MEWNFRKGMWKQGNDDYDNTMLLDNEPFKCSSQTIHEVDCFLS